MVVWYTTFYMKCKTTTLQNGLEILTIPLKDTNTVTVMILVETGTDWEVAENNGIAHFLEHMCFKGTQKRSAHEILETLDGLGAESNAFTSHQYTGYYARAHFKKTSKLVELLGDIYENSTFPEAEIEKERGVILEEINMYEDMPKRKVWDILYDAFYGEEHPAGFTVLGPSHNIKKMKRDVFVDFHEKHYTAGRTKVIVAGNLDEKKLQKQMKTVFENIPEGKRIRTNKPKIKQTKPVIRMQVKNSDQTALLTGFRSFPRGHKDNAAVSMLTTILGQGFSSRLHKVLREEHGLCYYVYAHSDRYTDRGHTVIGAGVGHKNVVLSTRLILDECRILTEELVGAKELKKAKDYILGISAIGLETSGDIAEYYGFQSVHGQSIKTPLQKFKEIRRVTAQDIRRVAKKIFKDENMAIAVVGPFADEKALKKVAKM